MKLRLKPFLYPVIVIGAGIGISSWLMANRQSSIDYAALATEVDPLADAPTVSSLQPLAGAYAPQLQLYSQLRSGQQVAINSPASAEVVFINVQEGDLVQAGDVLLSLDKVQLERQVAQLESRRLDISARRSAEQAQYQTNVSSLEVEQQLVAIAQRSVDRLSNLSSKNLASAAEIENAERTLQNQRLSLKNRELAIRRFESVDQQFQAQLQELDSQLDQAREQLADATVTAPFTAKVSQVQVQVGASLSAGQNLLTLVDPKQQELVAWVSANALDNVGDLPSLRGQLQLENSSIDVSLTHADPSANAGSLRLFFATENDENQLVLNRYYRMWVDLPTTQAFAVPESSVYSNQYVYTIGGSQLQRVAIDVVGERFEDGQLWRLVQGPLAGQDVLVTRLENVTQGLAVRSSGIKNSLAAAE